MLIVPNHLRDEINKKLDEQFAIVPDAKKDRDELYRQLISYVNEYGVIPDFSLTRTENERETIGKRENSNG